MDLKQYVSDAIRTESQIEKIQANATALNHILDIIIGSGTILDQVKKNVFYKKPINSVEFYDNLLKIQDAADMMKVYSSSHPATNINDIQIDTRMFHAIVGAVTEGAELAQALQKALNDSNFDLTNVLEEFGDINWYEAIAVDATNGDFQQILERNIAKLKARFPNKFTTEDAINRDLTKERNILEGKESS